MFQLKIAFSAAQVTVFSFIFTSLIGGLLLTRTESDRIVEGKQPIILTSNISLADSQQIDTLDIVNKEAISQPNTYIQNISYYGEKFIDMWFTAVSALCVTGLTSTDFASFSLPGQIITLILIQIGGLGIILFTSFLAMMVVRGLTERATFKELLSSIVGTHSHHVSRMVKHIIFYTLFFEILGFIVMGVHLSRFATDTSLLQGINPRWRSLFHSISAFNNAGFGLLNNNLMSFVLDPVINITIALLIIIGGLGYPVLIAIHTWIRRIIGRKKDKIQSSLFDDVKEVVASKLQIRIALYGTLFLLLLGMVIPFLADYTNPLLQDYTRSQKILIHFFQSASTRTAGFNTIDIGLLSYSTLLIYMGLMFVGANPGGTAGGIKIPTIAVLYGYLKDRFKQPGQATMILGRKVSKFAVSHSVRLFFFSVIFIFLISYGIMVIESKYLHTNDMVFTFSKILFETISAFGTVGLSMGFPGAVTSFSAILHPLSKVLIIIAMLFGRVGPLTFLDALPARQKLATYPLSKDFEDTDDLQIG